MKLLVKEDKQYSHVKLVPLSPLFSKQYFAVWICLVRLDLEEKFVWQYGHCIFWQQSLCLNNTIQICPLFFGNLESYYSENIRNLNGLIIPWIKIQIRQEILFPDIQTDIVWIFKKKRGRHKKRVCRFVGIQAVDIKVFNAVNIPLFFLDIFWLKPHIAN